MASEEREIAEEEDAHAIAMGRPPSALFSRTSSPPVPANMPGIFLTGTFQFSLDSQPNRSKWTHPTPIPIPLCPFNQTDAKGISGWVGTEKWIGWKAGWDNALPMSYSSWL